MPWSLSGIRNCGALLRARCLFITLLGERAEACGVREDGEEAGGTGGCWRGRRKRGADNRVFCVFEDTYSIEDYSA